MIKVSDYIIKRLEHEVNHIFTIPGGGCIHLIDSLGKSKISPVINLHEQAAGICAEAYSQESNNLGIALVTTGPGGTNIITAIASAWLDSVPLLVLAGQVQKKDMVANKNIRQNGFQEVNLIKMVDNITKYAETITDPTQVPYCLEKAIYLAKNGRPGPVVLEIPLDVQSHLINNDDLNIDISEFNDNKNTLNIDIENIIKAINESKRPIILAGNGVRLSKAYDEFLKFINFTKIPVLLTWKAIDFLPEDHELYVGRPGGVASRGSNFNQQNSDLIITLGARLDHGQIAYQSKFFAHHAKKIIVDIDHFEIRKHNINIDFEVESDCYVFLKKINENLNKIKVNCTDWLKHCKKTYNKYPIFSNEYNSDNYVNNYVFIEELSKYLPENSLIVPGSSGACSEVTMQAIKLKKGTRIFNSQGLGSMGFGLPAAIGACLSSNKNDTISIDGDGGFVMNLQELELVTRYNLPIKFFILNNNGYGSIKTTQINHFEGKLVGSDPDSGLTLPNFKKIAKAFNLPYVKIKNNKILCRNIKKILNQKGPMIVELIVDPDHKTLPKASVYKTKDGLFSTKPMEDMTPLLPREEFSREMLVPIIECE